MRTVRAVLKWFNDDAGYGFATSPDGELFVHASKLRVPDDRTKLTSGTIVECVVKQEPKGLAAHDIELIPVGKEVTRG